MVLLHTQSATVGHRMLHAVQGASIEFAAYYILYNVYTSDAKASTTALADLDDSMREEPAVRHALAVRSAQAICDYHKLFKLYRVRLMCCSMCP